MRIVTVIALLGLTAFAPAALAQQPVTQVPSNLPSITLPPELGRVLRDYEAGWRRGDAAALAALFAEDGFVMQNGQLPVRGRAAIRRAYEGKSGAPLALRALAVATADTIGYIIGAYGYGDNPGDIGKFTLTLKRKRGEPWLIFSDMDNGNRGPKPPAE